MATVSFKAEPSFLNLIGDTPDLYGPFWIATTLIFVIAVTSNLSRSISDGYDYDFELVTKCLSLVYGYLLCWPALVFGSSKYLLNITQGPGLLQLGCLLGYSLVIYLPAAFVATVSVLAWPALLAACAASSLFLLRSFQPFMTGQRERAGFTGGVVVTQLFFMLVIKVKFYTHGF
mmetsp:Transcript_28694/g.33884  ORF Transcript_28694/g.33884 Transcript_28694/m.33884 type:complete len:175 (+) Transcript_28694:183-707(+)